MRLKIILIIIISYKIYGNNFYTENITRTDKPIGKEWPEANSERYSKDNEYLKKAVVKLKSKGFVRSFIIVHRNSLVLEEYFHGAKKGDSENIHSASKSILSALVGIAVEEGYINSLNNYITDYLPPEYFKEDIHSDITIRDLITMSSGIKWTEDSTEYTISKENNYIKVILARGRAFEPGDGFNYSTGDTHLMSAVLTYATGMPIKEFAEKYLFNEVGISVEFWKQDPMGFYSGGCNFFATPMEMARFGQLYLNLGKWNGRRVIPKKWISDSFKISYNFSEFGEGYGYYWWINRIKSKAVYTAWGYAGQMIHIIPDLELVVVSTTDSNSEDAVNSESYSFSILEDYIIPAFE